MLCKRTIKRIYAEMIIPSVQEHYRDVLFGYLDYRDRLDNTAR